ncbi:hypothetical protein MRB53_005854 [Persea americana]|uniref:Uncharacterized protein n=1 Tax=Persea americana TaxID=3435 RepID=A0ACC2MFD7_PERAE|nr:hypothetical protein MRB53_005854 [Persea americana]
MVPLEGKRRWCRGMPERQRRRISGEQCRSSLNSHSQKAQAELGVFFLPSHVLHSSVKNYKPIIPVLINQVT